MVGLGFMWQLGVAGLGFGVASRGVVSDARCAEVQVGTWQ